MKAKSPPSGFRAQTTVFKTGSQIIVDTLRQLKVEVIFGYPGASVMPLFDCFMQEIAGFVHPPRQAAAIACPAGQSILSGKTFALKQRRYI